MRQLICLGLLLFWASAATCGERGQRYFALDVGIGPSYGVLGVGLEAKPVRWGGVFGTVFVADGIFSYAFGLRAYPLGDERFFRPFVHVYRWGFGLALRNSVESISSSGVGLGGEWVWESGRGLRLGCDFSSMDGSSVVFPFLAYTEKF